MGFQSNKKYRNANETGNFGSVLLFFWWIVFLYDFSIILLYKVIVLLVFLGSTSIKLNSPR